MITAALTLELELGETWPQYQFNVEPTSVVVQELSGDRQHVTVEFDLDHQLSLTYSGKTPQETVVDHNGVIVKDQTLALHRLYVDEFLLDMCVINDMGQYVPQYHQEYIKYCQDNCITIAYGAQHQTKFWHNGTWSMCWGQDFWSQYQQYRRARYATEHLNFTGYALKDMQDKLQHIKDLLNA